MYMKYLLCLFLWEIDIFIAKYSLITEDQFVIQWVKYVDGNDEHKLEFQAKLFPNGDIWFIYHNIVLEAKKAAEQTGYPVIIGLQNSFAGKDQETAKGICTVGYMSIYLNIIPWTFCQRS